MTIPFLSLKDITGRNSAEIQEAVARVVDSGWYLQGKEVAAFESSYAGYIGTRHCIGCGNGLDALSLMIRAYKEKGVLKDGDEIIVPANTYIATILAITENDLTPILVEPRQDTLQIDPSLIEQHIAPRTRAVMIVHLYGRLAYAESIGVLCRKHNLLLLEDNAQAHGCSYHGIHTGALGDAAAHSFYPSKNLGALGDAGAVTTNDEDLAEIIRTLGNYGSSRKYVFPYRGRNSRMDELQAAVLTAKLKHLDEDNNHRQRIATYYYDNIHNEAVTLPVRLNDDENVYHIFPILCRERDRLQQHLTAQGIQTAIHYPIPPHKQKCYKEWNSMRFPITERIALEELSLPISPAMSAEQAAIVAEAINHFT